jgi:hypothetical protein
MYFKSGNNKIITVTMPDRLYVITHIKHGYQDNEFFGQGYHDIVFSGEIINGIQGMTNEMTGSENEKYLLWHWRLNHLGLDTIRNLHNVTNFSSPIKVLTKLVICEVCILIKMTNRILKQLSIYKSNHLKLIYFDIAGPFLQSNCGNRYFILIIDSYSRLN